MESVLLNAMTVNGESRTFTFSDIISYMEEAMSCPHVLHTFIQSPHNNLTTVPFVPSLQSGRHKIDKAVGIHFHRCIVDDKINEDGHHLRYVFSRFYYIFVFQFDLYQQDQLATYHFQVNDSLFIFFEFLFFNSFIQYSLLFPPCRVSNQLNTISTTIFHQLNPL